MNSVKRARNGQLKFSIAAKRQQPVVGGLVVPFRWSWISQGLQPTHGGAPRQTTLELDSLADGAEGPHRKFRIPVPDRLPEGGLLVH